MHDTNGAARTSLEAHGRAIVERLSGDWRRAGGMCRCPAHDDRTPSLSVRLGERRLLFHCFAGCATRDVLRALRALQFLSPELRAGGNEPAATPADPGRRNRSAAVRLWAAARPIGNSPVEAYLRGRGLALEASDLRYHPRTPYGRGPQAIFRQPCSPRFVTRAGSLPCTEPISIRGRQASPICRFRNARSGGWGRALSGSVLPLTELWDGPRGSRRPWPRRC